MVLFTCNVKRSKVPLTKMVTLTMRVGEALISIIHSERKKCGAVLGVSATFIQATVLAPTN